MSDFYYCNCPVCYRDLGSFLLRRLLTDFYLVFGTLGIIE